MIATNALRETRDNCCFLNVRCPKMHAHSYMIRSMSSQLLCQTCIPILQLPPAPPNIHSPATFPSRWSRPDPYPWDPTCRIYILCRLVSCLINLRSPRRTTRPWNWSTNLKYYCLRQSLYTFINCATQPIFLFASCLIRFYLAIYYFSFLN